MFNSYRMAIGDRPNTFSIILLSLVLSIFVLVGCDGSSSSDDPEDPNNSNTSPLAQITTPAEGSTFSVGDVILFTGSCADTQDGTLKGASLVWNSDAVGQIGTGEAFASSTLNVGAHLITLIGTDTEGAEGMDTVAITINSLLPDTGQVTSYTDTFGEDADYTINPPAYTKLDVSGNDLNAGAVDWVMVRDDVTGLIWEVKKDDDSIHDKDDTYTWQSAQDTVIAQLNNTKFGGHSDWRLPTIKELSTLVHKDTFNPAINTAYFPNAMTSVYWSFTNYPSNMGSAYLVNFYYGLISILDKTNSYYVRAVCGGY